MPCPLPFDSTSEQSWQNWQTLRTTPPNSTGSSGTGSTRVRAAGLPALHGFPETWYGWRKQIPALAERFTVIAPDLRGYGDTDKPVSDYDKRTMANDVVIAPVDHLGHERIALVGHDRGARVGIRFAKDHRDRIDRFVAMDNIPTWIIDETYDVTLARQDYWFFTFLGEPAPRGEGRSCR
ncbi:alpha/beta fold hydrolase [Streptomyces canus]|uniref:alpha/beta fold hydrolase n=1 Tax=Streptomyces canus TaxID=58343 RepID=UPI0027D8A347|nr:alpha/beta hydrolase [Streptomyces canus]